VDGDKYSEAGDAAAEALAGLARPARPAAATAATQRIRLQLRPSRRFGWHGPGFL